MTRQEAIDEAVKRAYAKLPYTAGRCFSEFKNIRDQAREFFGGEVSHNFQKLREFIG
jgi:hypothetical protein